MKKSYLMIGQSNMAGRGDFGQIIPIVNESCTMLRCGLWRPMEDPVNPDQCIFNGPSAYNFHSGMSLMPSFADACQKFHACEIGLIPCAYGGSKLSQWMPGENLFENAVFQAKLAMKDSELSGIMWHQGESDGQFIEDASTYAERLVAMVTELRRRLNAENLPFVMGKLASFTQKYSNGKFAYISVVNDQIDKAATLLPKCAVVEVEGLGSRPDSLHFHTQALVSLGKRYFEAYMSLL